MSFRIDYIHTSPLWIHTIFVGGSGDCFTIHVKLIVEPYSIYRKKIINHWITFFFIFTMLLVDKISKTRSYIPMNISGLPIIIVIGSIVKQGKSHILGWWWWWRRKQQQTYVWTKWKYWKRERERNEENVRPLSTLSNTHTSLHWSQTKV